MPLSAMPEHLNSKEEIDAAFPDDEQFGTTTWYGRLYRWYNKATKTMFAFSYRSWEWWAKTKKYPKVLIAICDKNSSFRLEDEKGEVMDLGYRRIITNEYVESWRTATAPDGAPVWDVHPAYISRIQYYSRWHFAIQLTIWENIPFAFPMVSFHRYSKKEDVPEYGKPRPELDGKLWFLYWGHFDADLLHWLLTSGYVGKNWK